MERKTILERIYKEFYLVRQWSRSFDYSRANGYAMRAEGMIELLEVEDCGSCGGFDKDNRLVKTTEYKLYNRFLTVLAKENNVIEDLEPLTNYFRAL